MKIQIKAEDYINNKRPSSFVNSQNLHYSL